MNDPIVLKIPGAARATDTGNGRNLPVVTTVEWPTVVLILACSLVIVWVSVTAEQLPLSLAICILVIAVAFHSSLQHEVIHGHPSRSQRMNEALVFIPFGLFIPYVRFRDMHLQHHVDERLTDPYDDPESNYMDPSRWQLLSSVSKGFLTFNNTLTGRMLIGPLIGLFVMLGNDLRSILQGDRLVLNAYLLHVLGLVPWLWWYHEFASLPFWAYAVAAYLALSLLRVRTFLEHRAHHEVQARTVIVEDRGFFAWLFLNNNLHLVHHRHPRAPWYRLPALYRARREQFLQSNQGYVYSDYRAVFAAHLWRGKDPVPHPLRSRKVDRSAIATPDRPSP